MFLLRGFEFTHEAVRAWEEWFAPLLGRADASQTEGENGPALVLGRDTS
jgi:hypothetical protein